MNLLLPAVVPVLVGPLQVLLTLLPGLLLAMLGGIVALLKPTGIKNFVKLLWRQKIAVSVVVLLVAGIVFGWRAFDSGPAQGHVEQAQAGKPWLHARYDLARCGAVPGALTPKRPKLMWKFNQGGEAFLSSPAVVGNRLYIAASLLGSKTGQIYCLDADTGAIVWVSAPPAYWATFSSPVVSGDFLVCGEGLHETAKARVVCLDLRPGKEGKIVWTFATNNHVECTPTIANGKVYVGAGDDGFYCLDLAPGPDGEARVLWHLSGMEYPDAETSLAVHDGKVYLGLGNTGQALVVLDANTGKELKKVAFNYPVFSPPSIVDGKLYLGMGHGDYVRGGEGGAVCRLDVETLALDWTFPLTRTVLGAIAVKDDRLYFGCRDGFVYCLDRAGDLIAKRNLAAPIVTSPAVTDEAVFVVTDAGQLWPLERESLEPLWDPFRLGISGMFLSSPVVARGHVYVGTERDGLQCVGTSDESTRVVPLWTNPLGGPGRAGNIDNSPIPSASSVYWQFGVDPGGKRDDNVPPLIESNVAVWGQDIYVNVVSGRHQGIVCLPAGPVQERQPRPRWHCKLATAPEGAPVIFDDRIYVQAGGLCCIDRTTGKLLWRESSGQGLVSIGPGGAVWSEGLRAADGSWMWTQPEGNWSAPTFRQGMVFALDRAHGLGWLWDRDTGATLWHKPFPPSRTGPFLTKSRLLLGTKRGLEAFALVDGQPSADWQPAADGVSAEFAVREQAIYYVSDAGELVALDRRDGKVKFKLPGCLPGFAPVVSGNQAIVVREFGLGIAHLAADNPSLLLWAEEIRPCAPMVLADSCLYVPTRDRGLLCIGAGRE